MTQDLEALSGVADQIANARSLLFVPANRPERFGKAFDCGADMVILDLEDAVAPDQKSVARQYIKTSLTAERQALLRVNGRDTPDFALDLEICGLPGIVGIILSKAEHPEDLLEISRAAPGVKLVPLIETARGLANAADLAKTENVVRLLFGAIDFQLDLGIPGDGDALAAFRSQLVFVSRLAGLSKPVDGVSTGISNPAQLEYDIIRAKSFGFGGKLCIHPNQVAAVNEGFSPSAAEREWAEKILNALTTSPDNSGAISFEGQMIDRPVEMKARRIFKRSSAPR